jgi:hypothetical protein
MRTGVAGTSSHIGKRAIVIGAGISHTPAWRAAGNAGSWITRGRNEGT